MNSTQSGTVNISVNVANPAQFQPSPTLTPAAIRAIAYQPTINIFILVVIFGLVLNYLMTSYASNNLLFPINRNFVIPVKGFKLMIWKIRLFPLMIAFLTGLYGLVMAKKLILLLYIFVASYFLLIEFILPRKK